MVAPYEPAIEVSIDPEKVTAKPSRKLYLENAQVLAGVNTDQTFYSDTVLIFGDNLGDRRFYAVIESLSSYTVFDFSYWNISRRLQWGIRAFDQRTYYLGVGELGGQPTVERVKQAARYTGGSLMATYPLSRYFRTQGGLDFISRDVGYNYLTGATFPDGSPVFGFAQVKNTYPQANLQLIGDTVEYQQWGPRAGYRFMLTYSYAPDFSKDQSLPPGSSIGSTLTQSATVDLREYLPITKRMLFAFRAVGFKSTGQHPRHLRPRRPRHLPRRRLRGDLRQLVRVRQLRVPLPPDRPHRAAVHRLRGHPRPHFLRHRRRQVQGRPASSSGIRSSTS